MRLNVFKRCSQRRIYSDDRFLNQLNDSSKYELPVQSGYMAQITLAKMCVCVGQVRVWAEPARTSP